MMMFMNDCGKFVVVIVCLIVGDFIFVSFIIVISASISRFRFVSVVCGVGCVVCCFLIVLLLLVIGRKKL